jgi:lipoteichoic acid synthase
MNNYLKRYHYTDRQLGRYFQYLKSKGMYDNSIIVVVSDHDAHANFLNMSKEQINNAYLPFIIAHADLDPEKCWTEEMNQLDVFTTLLDLLNLETDWCGLGSSVLDKEHYENRLNDTTQKVSDLIIESNYWKSKE